MWHSFQSNGFHQRTAFTLGNVSCDMDSVVASIMLGYLLSSQHNEFIFPIINCNKKSFILKLDIMSCLSDHNILADDLLYFSEVDFAQLKDNYDVYLADHNELDINQQFLKDRVLGIIDHHVDSKSIDSTSFRVVRKAGSACTLIYTQYLDSIRADPVLSEQFGRLMLAPLFLDSFHFNPELYNVKYFDEDKEMVTILSELSKQKVDDSYYKNLQKLKEKSFDVKFLGLRNSIELDYKNYSIADTRIGISVVIGAFKDLLDNFSIDSLIEDLEKFATEKQLATYLLILYYESEGVFHKELLIFDHGYLKFPEFKTSLEESDLSLEKSGLVSTQQCVHYHMRNIKYTRKTIEPIVKKIITELNA